MRLTSYRTAGHATWGALVDDQRVVDLSTVGNLPIRTIREALERLGVAGIAERLGQADPATAVDLSTVTLLPVVTDPRKIVCIGLNYDAHRLEAKRAEVPHPTLFPRFATSQIGNGAPIVRPSCSEQLDFEGEIAVIVGRGGRRIAKADAWDAIAGYAIYNDASIRDFQYHTTQWTAGKNFDGTGAFGPWMVTRDEIADGERLEIVTRLNDTEVQRGDTDQLIFSIPTLIAYISEVMTLEPGDVIVTGTPSGVGVKREPPLFMKPGDRVEVTVTKLGTLTNPIVEERRA